MKRFLLGLLLITGTVYGGSTDGRDGGQMPPSIIVTGGKGSDGKLHPYATDVNGNLIIAGILNAAAITPSDSVDLTNAATRGVYVGVAGDVKVDLVGTGTAVVFKAAPVGILNVQAKRVYSTGTTATNLVALY